MQKETTNTYFRHNDYETEEYSYEYMNNIIDTAEPLLTVLVHGYGSDASVWSNNFEFFNKSQLEDFEDAQFTYDLDSLIERLRSLSNANVYYARMVSQESFELYRIKDLSENYYEVKDLFEEKGEKIYFGYLCGTSNGAIIISLDKYISDEFEIVTDINKNVSVGTEVSINGGSYEGTVITAGFTRICYLGNDAPDKTSRLNYEWNSSNEEIAIVSAYGTITAIRAGRVTITATYKNDKTLVGIIEIDVIPDYTDSKKQLKYGFDVREGGTTSGTEVTSGLGSKIYVSHSPAVTIHKQYTRLICLGNDSPNSSVQTFTWTAYQEYDTDTGMVTVSQYGTITGTSSGWLTIKGVYKYNSNYEVYIRIYVE